MSFNKVILHGNLTRDPELRYTPGGSAVAAFGVAVNRKWKGEDGQDHEEVTFVDVECWAKRAEVVAQYFRKGSQILVEGRLKLDQWEDKNTGDKRSKLKVVMESFSFVGTRDGGGDSGGERRQPPQRGQRSAENPQSDAPQGGEVPADPVEEDVPF